MGPVTTNPWLIAAINMTIVFGVLIVLGLVMLIIHWIDPTKKAKPVAKSAAKPAAAATSAAATAAAAAAKKVEEEKIVAAIAAAIVASDADDEMMAAITAAIMHQKNMEPLQLPHYFFEN